MGKGRNNIGAVLLTSCRYIFNEGKKNIVEKDIEAHKNFIYYKKAQYPYGSFREFFK